MPPICNGNSRTNACTRLNTHHVVRLREFSLEFRLFTCPRKRYEMMMLVVILQEFHIHLGQRDGTDIQCTHTHTHTHTHTQTHKHTNTHTHTHTYGMFTLIPNAYTSLTLACRCFRKCWPLTLACRSIKECSPSDSVLKHPCLMYMYGSTQFNYPYFMYILRGC